jgi:glycosyltransferase involved in cell wall biosynthesis
MERAACEVLERMAEGPDWQVSVVARSSEVRGAAFESIRTAQRPAVLGGKLFRWYAQRALGRLRPDVAASIGAATGPVDVIIAQFCHAAFTERFGGLRGGRGLRGVWQRFCQRVYVVEERAVYQHPRLKRVIAVSQGVGREICEYYGVDPEIIRIIPNGVHRSYFYPADVAEKVELRRELGLPQPCGNRTDGSGTREEFRRASSSLTGREETGEDSRHAEATNEPDGGDATNDAGEMSPGGKSARDSLREGEVEEGRKSARLPLRENVEMLACFVGGDWHRKGLADILQALTAVADVGLVVVGRGDVDAWQAICRQLGVDDRVWFIGPTDQPQRFMRASDVYVFPSRYEAFSLSCIEAASCGLPLVTTRINGSEELVEEGSNGFFVTFDHQSLIEPLIRLRDDWELRQRMSRAAAESALRYDWDTIAAEQAAVFAEAAALRAGRSGGTSWETSP